MHTDTPVEIFDNILDTRDEYTTVTAMTKFYKYFLFKQNLDYEIFQFNKQFSNGKTFD